MRQPLQAVRPLLGSVLLAATVLLAGCGGGGAPPPYGRYVALGDSYTAAPGVAPSVSDDPCGNSEVNYPRLLAKTLNATLDDASCSGAATSNFRSPQTTGGTTVPPQLRAVTRATRLVTIGIGGNDLDLVGLATECMQDHSTCAGDLGQIQSQLSQIGGRVDATIRAVRRRAPHAKVVVVGYPQLVPASGSCSELPIPEQYYSYVGAVMPALDRSLRSAARTAHATYVDVLSASKGHDVCSSDPWIAGISGDGAQQFHPNAEEQRAVAGLIAAALGAR